MWKTACLILFLLSAAFFWTAVLLGMAHFNEPSLGGASLLMLAAPLAPLYGWWRIRRSEITPEDIERGR
jgi:hypothetical protein